MERAGRASDWNGGSLEWPRHLLVTGQIVYLSTGCCRPDGRERASARGKSGLHRAHCQVTPGRGFTSTDSATESKPPMAHFSGHRQG